MHRHSPRESDTPPWLGTWRLYVDLRLGGARVSARETRGGRRAADDRLGRGAGVRWLAQLDQPRAVGRLGCSARGSRGSAVCGSHVRRPSRVVAAAPNRAARALSRVDLTDSRRLLCLSHRRVLQVRVDRHHISLFREDVFLCDRPGRHPLSRERLDAGTTRGLDSTGAAAHGSGARRRQRGTPILVCVTGSRHCRAWRGCVSARTTEPEVVVSSGQELSIGRHGKTFQRSGS
jgi:hypothetical protein